MSGKMRVFLNFLFLFRPVVVTEMAVVRCADKLRAGKRKDAVRHRLIWSATTRKLWPFFAYGLLLSEELYA